METPYIYYARDVRVVDGDTYDLTVDLGFQISQRIRVRLRGIDTPEIYGVKKGSDEHTRGMEAKKYAEEELAGHARVVVRTHKDAKEKYGRYLADIYVEEGDVLHSLADALLEEGVACKS